MINGMEVRDSDMSKESAATTTIYTGGESYTTINANEFYRLWTEANRATQDMRAIIDEMLSNQGISIKKCTI